MSKTTIEQDVRELEKEVTCIQCLTGLDRTTIANKLESLVINSPYDWRYWCDMIIQMAAVGNLTAEWFKTE